jgi:predicted peptidase
VGNIGLRGWSGFWALVLCGVAGAHSAIATDFVARSFKVGTNKPLAYRLFIPKGYQASRKYPVMLTLHGAGERGDNDTMQLKHDFNRMWADDSIQKNHPSFVVAPLCPAGSQWVNTPWADGTYRMDGIAMSEPMKAVVGILDSLAKEFNLDADRIYVSGLSMGGYGTWYLAMNFPHRFAAAVPVCGGADTSKAAAIAALPIWTFHAEDDGTVPVRGTREMVAALRKKGSQVVYTEYPKALNYNHQSWIPAGKTPTLPSWVFQQARAPTSLPQPMPGNPGSAFAKPEGWRPEPVNVLGRRAEGAFSGPAFALPRP